MKKPNKKNKALRTATITLRTTPAVKEMLAALAEKGYRSPARENDRLIIEAYLKL